MSGFTGSPPPSAAREQTRFTNFAQYSVVIKCYSFPTVEDAGHQKNEEDVKGGMSN